MLRPLAQHFPSLHPFERSMMHEAVRPTLEAWANFYVIVGSSAAALTGLQFVVLTLVAQAGAVRGREESIAAFGSPNVVHFCAALLVASILSAPWDTMLQVGIPVAACGVAGVIYSAEVLKRARRQRGYQPVVEDWIWHTILPALAYLALFVTGTLLRWHPSGALFFIGGAELLLLFIGIHNAWDTVTYVTMQQMAAERETIPASQAESRATSFDKTVPSSTPVAELPPSPSNTP
jgi:hypothetical protein